MNKDFKNLLQILKDKFDDLPSGYLTTQNIKCKDYDYYSYYLNKKIGKNSKIVFYGYWSCSALN